MNFYLLACGQQKRKCKKYGKRRGNKPSSFLHKIIILGFRRIYFKVAKKCQSLFICFIRNMNPTTSRIKNTLNIDIPRKIFSDYFRG